MPRPKSPITGQPPRCIIPQRKANYAHPYVRWTEAHHLTYLRLGGSTWLRKLVEDEMNKEKEKENE